MFVQKYRYNLRMDKGEVITQNRPGHWSGAHLYKEREIEERKKRGHGRGRQKEILTKPRYTHKSSGVPGFSLLVYCSALY